jgi:hypothetical protein
LVACAPTVQRGTTGFPNRLRGSSFEWGDTIKIETIRGLRIKKALADSTVLDSYVQLEIQALLALLEKYEIPRGDPDAFVFLALALARRHIKNFPFHGGRGRPKRFSLRSIGNPDTPQSKKLGAPIKRTPTFRENLLAIVDEQVKPKLRASTKGRVSDKEALLCFLRDYARETRKPNYWPQANLKTLQNQLAIARRESRQVGGKSQAN